MNLCKRIKELEAAKAGAEQLHVIRCQVGESDETAQARFIAETGRAIKPRDTVVLLQRFGNAPVDFERLGTVDRAGIANDTSG